MSNTTAGQAANEPTAPSTSTRPRLRRTPKGRNLTGAKAERFAKDVIDAYETMSIRAICQQTGRSYGAIHHLLKINKVTMRPRGYQHGMPASSADSS